MTPLDEELSWQQVCSRCRGSELQKGKGSVHINFLEALSVCEEEIGLTCRQIRK